MNYQFKRLCRVDVGRPNQSGISFDQNFKIEFEITKSITEETKYNVVKIYNLSRDTQKKLSDIIQQNQDLVSKNTPVMLLNLYAGYEEDAGLELLYSANIVNICTRRVPPETITEFTCAEGALSLKNNYISLGFNAGVGAKEILNSIAAGTELDIDDTSDIDDTNFAHGYSTTGTVKEVLNRYTKQLNSHWTLEKNKIRVSKIGGYTKDTVVDLSASAGLIGSPERIDTSGNDTDSPDVKHGWKIKCLLQPKLLPARQVKIESTTVTGVFIVDSVVHTGNTMDGDWQSEIEVKEGS